MQISFSIIDADICVYSQSRPPSFTTISQKINAIRSSKNVISKQDVLKLLNQIRESKTIAPAFNSNSSHGTKVFKEILKKMKKQKRIEHRTFRRELALNTPVNSENWIEKIDKGSPPCTNKPPTITENQPVGSNCISKFIRKGNLKICT